MGNFLPIGTGGQPLALVERDDQIPAEVNGLPSDRTADISATATTTSTQSRTAHLATPNEPMVRLDFIPGGFSSTVPDDGSTAPAAECPPGKECMPKPSEAWVGFFVRALELQALARQRRATREQSRNTAVTQVAAPLTTGTKPTKGGAR